MNWIWIAVGIEAALAALVWRVCERAPLGYQDRDGFNYGVQPEPAGETRESDSELSFSER